MVRNIYVIVTVVLRLLGLWFIAFAVMGLIFSTLIGAGFQGGRGNPGFMLLSTLPSLLAVVGGIILFFVARPVASIVVANLD